MLPTGGQLGQAGTTHQPCQILRLNCSLQLRLQRRGSCGGPSRAWVSGEGSVQSEKAHGSRGGSENEQTRAVGLALLPTSAPLESASLKYTLSSSSSRSEVGFPPFHPHVPSSIKTKPQRRQRLDGGRWNKKIMGWK